MNGISNEPSNVILGLGGNIGNVYGNIKSALELLHNSEHVSLKKVSPVYETPPWGIEDQPSFLNLCAQIVTSLDAESLLKLCLEIENSLNRMREVRWGPRTIDLDIILYENVQIETPDLTIPHPRIGERAFVLVPLADIAGDWQLHGKSVQSWRDQIDDTGIEKIYDGNEFNDIIY